MSFLLNENNGRRRIAQVSNDEWRAALQQQIDEKKQREQQQKRFRGFEDDRPPQQQHQQLSTSQPQYGDHDADFEPNNKDGWDANDSHYQQQLAQDQAMLMPRPGRRGVQQISNDAYREALEQQIREKKERETQTTGAAQQWRRSQSAPGQEGSLPEPESPYHQMDQERAMTTPSVGGNKNYSNNPDLQAGSYGRKRVGMHTQEEFAKSLQDQLEVQKRFEQEALEFKKAQRELRRKILVGDESESHAADPMVPAPASTAKASEAKSDSAAGGKELICSPKQLKSAEPETPEHKESEGGHSPDSGNQVEELSRSVSEPKKANVGGEPAAADPMALAKIVDFCEELKRQNEEVKQQLTEQHLVLASLRSSLVEAKAESKGAKQPALAKQIRSGGKKPHQAVHAAPQRKAGSLTAPRAEEKASRMTKTGNVGHKSSKFPSEMAVRPVEASIRAPVVPVVRSRPIVRGESKIPFPSGVSSTIPAPSSSVGAKELDMQETGRSASEAVAGTPSSNEEVALEAEDARPYDCTEVCSGQASRDDESECDAMAVLNEEFELRDAKEPQTERRESKLNSPEEHVDNELQLVQSESYLIIDDEAEFLDDDELPLGCESKLLSCEVSPRHAGDEGEIKSCSSFVLVDGASSLVALDHSLDDLFYQ